MVSSVLCPSLACLRTCCLQLDYQRALCPPILFVYHVLADVHASRRTWGTGTEIDCSIMLRYHAKLTVFSVRESTGVFANGAGGGGMVVRGGGLIVE